MVVALKIMENADALIKKKLLTSNKSPYKRRRPISNSLMSSHIANRQTEKKCCNFIWKYFKANDL